MALLSRADELFYGGAAGGGKTDLLLGLASECHHHSAIFRRVYPNLKGIIRRARELLTNYAKENKSEKIWNFPDGRAIEFGAVQYEDNKTNWQGRPHDFYGFDELPEFSESQYEFICGWNRTTDKNQRTRIVAAGNPPINEAGNWIIKRWGPWLDDKHHNPAEPGELRWYATVAGEQQEFPNGDAVTIKGEEIYPRSRTFIPAKVTDNPFYADDHRYIGVLQSLPEPIRSMFLYGDFQAAASIDPWQVIPTEWVLLAQERWTQRDKPDTQLTCVGIDPARGGRDNMALSKRYDNYFDEIVWWPGVMTTTGPKSAELIRQAIGEERPLGINVDVIGYGASTYDSLCGIYEVVRPINAAGGSDYRDKSGKLKMRNVRAEYYWRMREALDPSTGDNVALPPGNEIVADLCSARYNVSTSGILIEKKDEIKKRIGRSPDKGEAILLANFYRQRFIDLDGLGSVDGYENRWN